MQTIYLLNTQELNMTFIKSLKSLLPNQDIEIKVSTVLSNNFIDEIPLMAESSLADGWNSSDDQRWDNISVSPSFDFLYDKAEDIYSLNDGTPINYEE